MLFLLMMEVFSKMLRHMEEAGIIRDFKVRGVGGDSYAYFICYLQIMPFCSVILALNGFFV